MQVKNITKNTIIVDNCRRCTSFLSKATGLMYKKTCTPLLFTFTTERIVALHMFFVFFPIDVLFLDTDKKVVEIKENFKPWSYYKPKNKALYVIELPAGTIEETNTSVGDHLNFV